MNIKPPLKTKSLTKLLVTKLLNLLVSAPACPGHQSESAPVSHTLSSLFESPFCILDCLPLSGYCSVFIFVPITCLFAACFLCLPVSSTSVPKFGNLGPTGCQTTGGKENTYKHKNTQLHSAAVQL